MNAAVLSDIHGNLPALRAVIADIRSLDLDLIVCCGDIASGPLPVETLDYIHALDIPFHSVSGNADRGVVEAFDGAPNDNIPTDDVWTGQSIRSEHRDFLAGLPSTLEMKLGALGPVLFCHGSPRADDEILTDATPSADIADMLAAVAAPIVACGHTHMQFDRSIGRHRLINPGSVGRPYGDPGAYWAVLGPTIEFRRTDYDIPLAVAEILRKSAWGWASTFCDAITSPPSRETALDFFANRAVSRAAANDHHGSEQ